MLYQVDDALPHAMSGTELSRARTELWLPKANNNTLIASRGAVAIVASAIVRAPYFLTLMLLPLLAFSSLATIQTISRQTP
jgi:hypothetical protein